VEKGYLKQLEQLIGLLKAL